MRVPVKLLGFAFWLFFFNCVQCQAKKKTCRALSVNNGFTYRLPSNQEEIFYSCNEGYKPFTGKWWDSVTCREGSWSDEPRCIREEECGAFPSVHHGKLTLRDQGTVEVECDPGFISTSPFIKCVSGTWDTPVCKVGARCNIPPKVEYAFIRSKPEEFYIDGSYVTYLCQTSFSMNGKSTVFCLNGTWEDPPTCKEITCPLSTTVGDLIIERLPDDDGPVKPEHKLIFSCNEQGLKLVGPSEIKCESNGEWSSPFPKCEEVTCPLNTTVENIKMKRSPNFEGPAKPGHKLIFSCNEQGRGTRLKLNGQSKITCQPNGQWSSSFPKCEEVMCVANLPANMRSDRHLGSVVSIRPGDTITLSCVGRGSEFQGQSKIKCRQNGEWNVQQFPKCVGGKCGPPPKVEFADTIEMQKTQYNSGERVEYGCFNKYKLVQHHRDSKYYTCEQGEWRGNITCLKPCTVTVEEMDKRGIELQWGGREKIFSPHDDVITFACQWGKQHLKVNALIQYCNDGVMILPECV